MKLHTLIASVLVLSSCSRMKEATTSSSVDSVATEAADSIAVNYSAIESYVHPGLVDTAAVDIIDFDCALLVYPTEEQIETMKKEYGEDDFYTVADDSQFYQGAAVEKLDSAGIPQIVSNIKRYVRFKGSAGDWTLDVRKKGFPEWNIIFFKKEKAPKVVFAIDLNNDSIQAYFKK